MYGITFVRSTHTIKYLKAGKNLFANEQPLHGPIHARIQRGAGGPDLPFPWKSPKYRVSLAILVQIPWKITKLTSQYSMLAGIIGTPANRHLMAFRWWADNGPLFLVIGIWDPPSFYQLKKHQSRTPSYKTFWSERRGPVEECLTRDRGAAGSSLTGVTVLCPWARTLIIA